jgi:hypothetical protein
MKAIIYIMECFKEKDTNIIKELDLEIMYGNFKSKEDAEISSSTAKAVIKKNNIIIQSNGKEYPADKIVFKKLKSGKELGRVLDPSNPEELEKIVDSLSLDHPLNRQYMITEDDMEETEYSINTFVKSYPDKTYLQVVGYGTKN